jgi:hypothetical protein
VDARRLAAGRQLPAPAQAREVAQLIDPVKQGTIEIASLYTNIEQENAAPEELVRSTFYANERLRREFGIAAKTAILSDITGITSDVEAGHALGIPSFLVGEGCGTPFADAAQQIEDAERGA